MTGSPTGAAGPAAFWLGEVCRAPGAADPQPRGEQPRSLLAAPGLPCVPGDTSRRSLAAASLSTTLVSLHRSRTTSRAPGLVSRLKPWPCPRVGATKRGRAGRSTAVPRLWVPRWSRGGREVSRNAVRVFFHRRVNTSPGMSGPRASGERLVLACWGSPAAVVSGHGAARSQRVGARDSSGCGGLWGRQAAGALPASGTGGAGPGLQPRALLGSSDQAQILPRVPALQSATPAPIAVTTHSQELAFPQPLPPSCPQIPAGVPATALPLPVWLCRGDTR